MPNWITNNVTIIASEKVLAKIKDKVKSDVREFDFNNILPIPKELVGTRAPLKIITPATTNDNTNKIIVIILLLLFL